MTTDGADGRRQTSPACLWLALAAAGLATFAVWLAFYRLVVRFDEGTIVLGISGWHYAVALLSWSAVLAVAVACVGGRVATMSGTAGRTLGAVTAALGLLAVVAVALALIDRPTVAELALSAVEHLDAEELRETAAPSIGWTRDSGGVEYGAGLYLLALAAVLSLVSGLLRLRAVRGDRR